jgi:hypothetical protein
MELDCDQIIYQHAQAGRQKKNKEEERNNSEAKTKHDISQERIHLQKHKPSD